MTYLEYLLSLTSLKFIITLSLLIHTVIFNFIFNRDIGQNLKLFFNGMLWILDSHNLFPFIYNKAAFQTKINSECFLTMHNLITNISSCQILTPSI